MERKIIHIDMDAFYASVEQRDEPEYRGKPIIVGGSKDKRGVVAAASYEAREFGVRSAMSSKVASQLCKDAIFVKPRMKAYQQESKRIMEILHRYSDLVEPLSLDEAYIDVTENKKNEKIATTLAKKIREEIFQETQLTASAGVAPNKFLAKVASDLHKPNGLCVLSPERIPLILPDLPIRVIPGIGKKTESQMLQMGVRTIRDLQQIGFNDLQNIFGKRGRWFFDTARGIDTRPVSPYRKRKSMSVENTFSADLIDLGSIEEQLLKLSHRLFDRLTARQLEGRTLILKITYSDFRKITRSHTQDDLFSTQASIYDSALQLLGSTSAGSIPLRLLGLGVSSFGALESPRATEAEQLKLPL
jgi:DNA polymerase-4